MGQIFQCDSDPGQETNQKHTWTQKQIFQCDEDPGQETNDKSNPVAKTCKQRYQNKWRNESQEDTTTRPSVDKQKSGENMD